MTRGYAIAVIVNHRRDRFLVHRKDETYSRPHAIAFFGGAIEDGEDAVEAFVREMIEELGEAGGRVVVDGLNAGWTYGSFTVFEVVLDDDDLSQIEEMPVYEGERAETWSRPNLRDLPWLAELRPIVDEYLRVTPVVETVRGTN